MNTLSAANNELIAAFPVFDLHSHPSLKTFLFGRKLWRNYPAPGYTMPLTLRSTAQSWRDGGVGALLAACYVLEKDLLPDVWPLRLVRPLYAQLDHIFREPYDDCTREQLTEMEYQVRETEKQLGPIVQFAHSYSELQHIRSAGKTAVLHGMEGSHHLNGDLDNLNELYERGVCQIIVAHLYPNDAGPCVDAFPSDNVLKKVGCLHPEVDLEASWTPWGRELIERMLTIGMLVDLTHATPKCRHEAYEIARAHPVKRPLILSHVGILKYRDHPMNPSDEEIKAVADTGGVIGIIAMTYYLGWPKPSEGLPRIKEIIDHMIDKGGEDVVAFGSDFDGFTGPPRDWCSPRDYVKVREFLLKHYTEEQVRKFLYGNADRALRMGWGRR